MRKFFRLIGAKVIELHGEAVIHRKTYALRVNDRS